METIDNALNTAHEAVDKIANAASQAAEVLGEKGEQLKNAEHRLMDNCHSYVRTNPIASIGIAVAAGFMLSRLLSGR
ncbi:MAG: DUF883 domain-containing protein [Methylovulum sp.]|nr:DUF883 domain-containing protein [Methylovulum sp.]